MSGCKICDDPTNPFRGGCAHNAAPHYPKEELKPCFFCGEKMTTIQSNTWKGIYVECMKCVRILGINPEKYNESYCWKVIDKQAKELEATRKILFLFAFEKGDLTKDHVERMISLYLEGKELELKFPNGNKSK